MRNGKPEKGFTLIELVVVIAVLAILAGVAVPKFLSITSQATEAAEKADVGAVRSGILTTAVQNASKSGSGTLTFPALTAPTTAKTAGGQAFPEVLEEAAALDLNERGWIAVEAGKSFKGPAGNTYTYDATKGTFLKTTTGP